MVRQKKAVLSWPLPILSNFDKYVNIVDVHFLADAPKCLILLLCDFSKLYNVASRTLCGEVQEGAAEKTIYVIVSTSSEKNISFSIQVSLEHNFIMRLGLID